MRSLFLVSASCLLLVLSPATILGKNADHPTHLLTFDHGKSIWTLYSVGGCCKRSLTTVMDALELDANGIPTVALPSGSIVQIGIANSNPLLYRVQRGHVDVEDVGGWDKMRDLTTRLGGAISRALDLSAPNTTNNDTKVKPHVNIPQDQTLAAINEYWKQQTVEIVAEAREMQELKENVAELVKLQRFYSDLAQDAESSLSVTWQNEFGGVNWDSVLIRETNARKGIDTLTAHDRGKSADYFRQSFAKLEPLVTTLAIEFNSQNWLDALRSYESALMIDGLTCNDQGCAKLKIALATILREAKSSKKKDWPTYARKYADGIKGVVAAQAAHASLRTAFVEMAKLREPTRSAAHALYQATSRCKSALKDGCYRAGEEGTPIHILLMPGPAISVRTNKSFAGEFEVVVDSSVAKDIVLSRQPVSGAKFRIRSDIARWWDIGLAVTTTKLKQPVWTAVADPFDESDDPRLLLTRTATKYKRGQIVLFANVRPLTIRVESGRNWILEPGLELGGGLDVKKPAVYLGCSVTLCQIVRLGYGTTWQPLEFLAPGEYELAYGADGLPIMGSGTVVAGQDAIRTDEKYDADTYWSLTISLLDLPFFDGAK